jgi:REP element-mobilizing transposase RayT
MRRAREQIVDLSVTPYYHCMSRCVRRAFLCGEDPYTGESYEHRKAWVRDRLRELAALFAMDVCAYAVMSNHLHVVLRVVVDRAAGWSDEEVARRYTALHPMAIASWEATLTRAQRSNLVESWRERLCDLSWMMRTLNEHIARMANKEEKVRGRFWEGRFKSQPILDERGLLVCMAYVDLNPMRAGIADSVETSEFTSIEERLFDQATKRKSRRKQTAPRTLAPMLDQEPSGEPAEPLPMTLDDYRTLLEWTASARDAAPPEGPPPRILARTGLNAAAWLRTLEDERVETATFLGSPEAVIAHAEAHGQAWHRGIGLARQLAAA